jgi:hypothetical protein
MDMSRIVISEIALAACLTSGAFLNLSHRGKSVRHVEQQHALDGAFRDGLFIGSLTAETGLSSRPPVGRWSNPSDRASFLAGYQHGYDEVLRASSGNHDRTE